MKCIKNSKNKGFTLIEVIVAVSIVIILSTLAVPKVSGYIAKAKEAKTMSMGKQIYTSTMWSYSDQGNTFDSDKIVTAVTNTTNISLEKAKVDTTTDTTYVTIKFSNDNKDYELSINKVTNDYKIYDITTIDTQKLVFDSTK